MQRAARKDGPFPIKNPRLPQRLFRPARGPRPRARGQRPSRASAPESAPTRMEQRPLPPFRTRTRVRGPLPPRPLPQNASPALGFSPRRRRPALRMRCRKNAVRRPSPRPLPQALSPLRPQSPAHKKSRALSDTTATGMGKPPRRPEQCAMRRTPSRTPSRTPPRNTPRNTQGCGEEEKNRPGFSPSPFVYSMPNSYCSSLSSTADMIMAMTPETMAAVSAGTSVTSLSSRRRKNTPGHSCVFVLTMGST